jgi:hypothetical protein
MGLLWGAVPSAERHRAPTAEGADEIIDKFASSLRANGYATLGHCVQNSLTLPCVD